MLTEYVAYTPTQYFLTNGRKSPIHVLLYNTLYFLQQNVNKLAFFEKND